MGVRNETNGDAIRARDAALAADHAREPQPRAPANIEQVDRFQQLMQQAQGRGGSEEKGRLQQALAEASQQGDARADARASEDAVAAIGSDPQRDTAADRQDTGLSHQTLEQSDAMAFLQAQMGLRGDGMVAPQQAPAAPAANAQAMADLVERHVRQMAVGGADGGGDGQVLLRMSDATLPGTDLMLTRTADGWSLRADSRSRDSYDAIREAAPELAKRFAERNLGTLEVDTHYNG